MTWVPYAPDGRRLARGSYGAVLDEAEERRIGVRTTHGHDTGDPAYGFHLIRHGFAIVPEATQRDVRRAA